MSCMVVRFQCKPFLKKQKYPMELDTSYLIAIQQRTKSFNNKYIKFI